MPRWLFTVVLAVWIALPGAAAMGQAAAVAAGDDDALVRVLAAPWTGDLDGIIERGYLRVGVAYGPPFFLYDRANQEGISVDLGQALEQHLQAKLGDRARTLTVVLAPLPRDRMLDALLDGRLAVVAANLTITSERAARVAFSDPLLRNMKELVVTGPSAPPIANLDDLVPVGLDVRPSSSHHGHLVALNAARVAAGQPPIPLVAANENLEDFDLFELLDVGVVPALVVADHKAALYAGLFDHVTAHADFAIHEGGEIAWAVRPDAPNLLAAVNGFVTTAKKGTELGNILFRRWFRDTDRIRNAITPGEDVKFAEPIGFIPNHAETYDFDPILSAAQGYQESRLDQSKRSHAGASGIMQVMPATASDPVVNIPDIDIAERNVEAGVKYLRLLRDRYCNEPMIGELDQTLFTVAAYNAGRGFIAKARAEAMGLDPDVWLGNVEVAAARVVSREPVVHVRNILKITYRLYRERQTAD